METYLDPLDALARLNPVPDERALPPTRAYVPAQRTLATILEHARAAAPTRAPERRRRRLAIVGAAAGIVALVAAAAGWVLTRPAGNPGQIACYASPALDADVADASAGEGDPIAACQDVWRNGAFAGWGGVPPLAACVLPSELIGVFPGDPSVCDRLGLARFSTNASAATITELVVSLSRALAAPRCVDVAAATDLVRTRLDELGLQGWTLIAPATTTPDRPCASIAFDPPARTVTLVPVPPPGT